MNDDNLKQELEIVKKKMIEMESAIKQAKPSLLSRIRNNTFALIGIVLFAFVGGSILYGVTVTNTFTSGTEISSSAVNNNFTALATAINQNASDISTDSAQITANTAAENGTQVVYLKDIKADTVTGGTNTAGVWQTSAPFPQTAHPVKIERLTIKWLS